MNPEASASVTHGESYRSAGGETPEYRLWRMIRERTRSDHPNYGGRGISLHPSWERYDAFLADVGRRPSPDHSLDRIDNDRGYEPGNVRWATREEQQRNTRRTRFVEHDGRKASVSEFARKAGMPANTVHERLDRGWSVGDALSVPVGVRRGKAR